MPDLSPSETLRAAAAKLREMAEKATPGPWRYTDEDARYNPCVMAGRDEWVAECGPADSLRAPGARGEHDARWLVVMSPAVAEPLAAELEAHAVAIEITEERGDPSAVVMHRAAYMLAFARCILEGQP